jgi:hypothetical protein
MDSTYYYISSEGLVRSSSFTCTKDLWKTVRYNLETSNGQFVNNRTYLKGYSKVETIGPEDATINPRPNMHIELQENAMVPDVFFVHRLPLLPGMKNFFPATEYPKYQHLKQRLDTLSQEMKDAQNNFLQQLNGKQMFLKQDNTYQKCLEESREIFETLKSFEEKEGYHSSKVNIKYETLEVHPDVIISRAIAVPPLGYICQKCGSSEHFKDICTKSKSTILQDYGAAKLKKFVLNDQPEGKDLTNLYLKVFLPK